MNMRNVSFFLSLRISFFTQNLLNFCNNIRLAILFYFFIFKSSNKFLSYENENIIYTCKQHGKHTGISCPFCIQPAPVPVEIPNLGLGCANL